MLSPKTIVTDMHIISIVPAPKLLGTMGEYVRFRSEDSCIWQTDQQLNINKL